MKRFFCTALCCALLFACTDPNVIGLEVQPPSDRIVISNESLTTFSISTESEDSLRSDEALNLILGEIENDQILSKSIIARFYTQILLTENNTDLGTNPIVDSVVMSYTYSGYYGELVDFSGIWMMEMVGHIYKDSTYYSTFEILNADMPYNYVESFSLNTELEESPVLKMNLQNNLGQKILDFGNDILKDNDSFLEEFYGLELSAEATNTMLYLNPDGSNSYFKIYYHNDESGTDTLSLDFELGGDVARINLFNPKPLSSLNEVVGKTYIQSMAGYKAKIILEDISAIKEQLKGKLINQVLLSFQATDFATYAAHEKLFLVRVDADSNNVFLTDLTIEGEAHFGGTLDGETYTFNITRYFSDLMHNHPDYTNALYLMPSGAVANANRTILDNSKMKLTILYSEL